MRPTITEQLEGIGRILRDVVAPRVADANATEQLGHAATVLAGLATTWMTFLPRLRTDTAELRALLAEIDGATPLPNEPEDQFDVVAVDAHHTELRARLAAVIPTVAPEHRAALERYLHAHTTRF